MGFKFKKPGHLLVVAACPVDQLAELHKPCAWGKASSRYTFVTVPKVPESTKIADLAVGYKLFQVFGADSIDDYWKSLVLEAKSLGLPFIDTTVPRSKAFLFLRWHARIRNLKRIESVSYKTLSSSLSS